MFKLGNPKLSLDLALESWVGGRSKDMLILFCIFLFQEKNGVVLKDRNGGRCVTRSSLRF